MKDYYRLLQQALRSSTFLDLVKITLGKIANGTAAFLSNIIIARSLGATGFALYTLSRSIHVITLEIVGSDAVNTGMVRFASQYFLDEKHKANQFFKIVLRYNIFIILAFLLPVLLLTKPFLEHIINKPELSVAVIFGIIGGSCALLHRYVMAVMQSQQRFTAYAILDFVPNLCKLLLFGLLLIAGLLNLINALIINAATVLFGAIIGFYMIPKCSTTSSINPKKTALKLFHFSKWIWITNLIYTLNARADIFLLSYFTSQEQLGLYSAAISFIFGLDLLYMSIMTIFLPKISNLTCKKDYIHHIKNSLIVSFCIAVLTIPLFVFDEQLIVIAFSKDFIGSVKIFQILLVGFLSVLLIHPLLLVLYARKKTYLMTIVHFLTFFLNFASCVYLIPKYDALGAAYAVSASKIFAGFLIVFFVYREILLSDATYEEQIN